MVRVDGEGLIGEEDAPLLDALLDGQQLAVQRVIFGLGPVELAAVECDGMLAVCAFLAEHASDAVAGRVGVHHERQAVVRAAQHLVVQQRPFESVEGRLALRGPLPLHALLEQAEEWVCDLRVAGHVVLVVLRHAEKRAQLGNVGGRGHLADGLDAVGQGTDGALLDQVAEEFDLLESELALDGLGAEVGRLHAREDLVEEGEVFVPRLREDEDVVEVRPPRPRSPCRGNRRRRSGGTRRDRS